MFLHSLGTGLLRRWYFVLVGVLLTAGAGLFAWTAVPPSYEATSKAVLLPPSSLVGEDGNPYLYMGGLEQVLTVLTVRLSSTEVAEPLIRGRGNLGFLVEKDPNSPGPIMQITATGDSQDSAMALLGDVIRVIPENLAVMQDQLRIPTYSRVQVMTIVQDDTAALLIKDQLRMLLVVVAGGLAVTILVTALLDRVMTSRKKKLGEQHYPASKQITTLLLKPQPQQAEIQPSYRRQARDAVGSGPAAATGPRRREREQEVPTMASNK